MDIPPQSRYAAAMYLWALHSGDTSELPRVRGITDDLLGYLALLHDQRAIDF